MRLLVRDNLYFLCSLAGGLGVLMVLGALRYLLSSVFSLAAATLYSSIELSSSSNGLRKRDKWCMDDCCEAPNQSQFRIEAIAFKI